MSVSLALMLLGTDDDPRWVADARPGGLSAPRWNRCCEEGHYTPEAAAQHGAELAAGLLVREARSLAPETAGAAAIRKLEAAA
jgi:hypothetical protein